MIQIIGVPFDSNSSFLKGPALAPQRIWLMDTEGSANRYAENGTEIMEGINYHYNGEIGFNGTNPKHAFSTISESIGKLLEKNNKVLSIGGDHSVSYPIINTFLDRYEGLNILHFDAHADLYDDFDDNPYSHASPFARLMETGKVASLTQVGIRTLNTHQREQANRFDVKVIEMKDFSTRFLADLKGPLYITLDLDVLDPAFAPGVSHYEPGGMSTRQIIDCIQHIPVEVVGADLVEYNPVRDINNMTAMIAYKLLKELVAKML